MGSLVNIVGYIYGRNDATDITDPQSGVYDH